MNPGTTDKEVDKRGSISAEVNDRRRQRQRKRALSEAGLRAINKCINLHKGCLQGWGQGTVSLTGTSPAGAAAAFGSVKRESGRLILRARSPRCAHSGPPSVKVGGNFRPTAVTRG
jgi:hypothetical protein